MDRRSQIEAAITQQETLRGIVSDEIIDATIAALRSSLQDTPSQPRRKLVTVLFSDVAGFTEWSEHADAEDIGEVMNEVWRTLDEIVTNHNGWVDKHIGDAVMAVWGTATAREDDPENAVRAALAMQSAFAEMAGPGGVLENSDLRLRVGINTGPVILREVGSGSEFTAMGDTVNTAARLESAAPVGEVLIGHETYRHVRGVFQVAERPPLQVKGKSGELRTYLVTDVAPRALRLRTRGVEDVETRMVGREREWTTLQRLFQESVDTSSSRLVTVVGEAGLGKSRLLYEFLDWLQTQAAAVTILPGRAAAQGQTTPYALVKDLLFFGFGIREDDSPTDAVAKLVAGFHELAGVGTDGSHPAAHLIGLDVRDSSVIAGILDDPQLLRDRAERAIARMVQQGARSSPVVVALEDIHWADPASLDLMERIVDEAADAPLLMVAFTRPVLFENHPAWGRSGLRIDLTALSPNASRALVDDVLRRLNSPPAALVERIVATADGNPFYVEELVKSLIDAGTIRVGEASWSIDEESALRLAIPATLTALLQARLDRLSATARTTLQVASVYGGAFWDEALAGDMEPGELAAALDELGRRGLIFEHQDSAFRSAREFAFAHAILRDVTYETVLRSERRVYHRRAAAWLATKPDPDARAAVIADHYDRAGDPQAAGWYVRAGTQARLRSANVEALDAYTNALRIGGLDDDTAFEAYDGSGDVLMILARYEEAVAAHRGMLDRARAVGDKQAEARALTGVLFGEARLANVDLEALAEQTVATIRSMPDPDQKLLAEALRGAGWISFRAGMMEHAKRLAEEAAATADAARDRRGLALSLNLLSLSEGALGEHAPADDHMELALAIVRELGDRRSEGTTLMNLGESARRRGEYEAAVAHNLQALRIHRELADHDNEALCLNNLGGAYVGLHRFEEAAELLNDARRRFEETGRLEYLSETKRFLAEAALGTGRTQEGTELAASALEDGLRTASSEQIGHAWRVLGIAGGLLTGTVQVDGAAMSTDECFTLSVEHLAGDSLQRAVALADWARAKATADPAAARRMWDAAMAVLTPPGLASLAGRPPTT